MTPAEIRDATITQLREARTKLLSASWVLSLEGKGEKTQANAARQLMRIHHAIQKLENEELSNIRDALVANEKDLEKGTAKLGKALKNLGRVKSVLTAVNGFLGVIARVIPLIL
jgi:hypothetical protein